ncbi:MAG: hypothetical protein KDA89_17045 [Planctomycetaceae bacterium]|nr:hypothetical protein [Planctomycetaceae bacterium]
MRTQPSAARQWWHKALGQCCGVSTVFHVIVLLILAMIVLPEPVENTMTIDSGFTPPEDAATATLITAEVELLPQVSDSPAIDRLTLATGISSPIAAPSLNIGSADGDNKGEPSVGFPIGTNAVEKGNFTAWTVPSDPEPWKDYLIVIQIKLPDDVTRYRQEDLSGFLTGDDGYTTPIGEFNGRGFPRKYYGEFDDKARQFVIRIPGAAKKVQDKIEVQSRVLKERQVLFIVF